MNIRMITRIGAWAAASVVALLGLRAVLLSVNLLLTQTRPIVFGDEWVFVSWYFAYLEGTLSLKNFFDLWGDHRVLTTRVVLALDAMYFDLKSQMPIAVLYGSLLLTAALIARLAFERGPARILGFAVALGLLWSTCQWENLSSAFQVGHAFLHLFALVTCLALAQALVHDSSHRYFWLAIACVADFLAIYSMGPGMLTIVPAVAMGIWLGRLNRRFWMFVLFHVAVLAVYFSDYVVPRYGELPGGTPFAYIDFFAKFLGSPFRAWHEYQFAIGISVAVFFLAAASGLTFVALIRRTAIDTAAAVIFATAFFAFLEALAATYGRVHAGVAPRYATAAVVLIACLLAFFWRIARARELTSYFARTALMGLSALILLGASSPYYDAEWRQRIALHDNAAFALINGIFPDAQVKAVFVDLDVARIKRLAGFRWGQFSPTAFAYQAPLNTLVGVNFNALPLCRYGIERVSGENLEWSRIEGWALHPTEPTPVEWILAFNQDGRLVGYTRPAIWRADAARALTNPYAGFDLYLSRTAQEPNRQTSAQLIATLNPRNDEKRPRACRMPASPIGLQTQ